MPRSRASGCAIWRVRAASARAEPASRPLPVRALRDGRAASSRRASPPLSRRAPERPAHAPELAISWHQPSRLRGRMARETTLVLVKPDGMRRGLAGEIVARFERRGLELRGARLLKVSKSMGREHYAEHKGKP